MKTRYPQPGDGRSKAEGAWLEHATELPAPPFQGGSSPVRIPSMGGETETRTLNGITRYTASNGAPDPAGSSPWCPRGESNTQGRFRGPAAYSVGGDKSWRARGRTWTLMVQSHACCLLHHSPMVGMGRLESPASRPPAACSTPELHPVASGRQGMILPPLGPEPSALPLRHYPLV